MRKKIKRKSFALSSRHTDLLESLAKELDIPMTQVVQRALESLEEVVVRRRNEVSK